MTPEERQWIMTSEGMKPLVDYQHAIADAERRGFDAGLRAVASAAHGLQLDILRLPFKPPSSADRRTMGFQEYLDAAERRGWERCREAAAEKAQAAIEAVPDDWGLTYTEGYCDACEVLTEGIRALEPPDNK